MCRWSPHSATFEHVVENEDQLSHASYNCDLPTLPSGPEALVEGPDYRVVSPGDNGSHVKDSSDLSAPAPNDAFTPIDTAVSVKRSDTHKMCNRFAVQGAQLGQLGKKGQRSDRTDPRGALEDLVLRSPCRAVLDLCGQVLFDARLFSLKPLDVGLDARSNSLGRTAETVALRHDHPDDLTGLVDTHASL